MTGMDDLVTWLRAQLDEDERVAKAATVGPWQATPSVNSVHASPGAVVLRTDVELDEPWSSKWVTPYVVPPDSEGSDGIEPADAEHIARWDPAHVLRKVAADRRILDEAVRLMSYDGEFQFLELLALPFAARPGYREEWRPC